MSVSCHVLFLTQFSPLIFTTVLSRVQYFMDECRKGLEKECGERSHELQGMADLGQRLELVVRLRLEQQALYTSTWAQALSIQVQQYAVIIVQHSTLDLLQYGVLIMVQSHSERCTIGQSVHS